MKEKQLDTEVIQMAEVFKALGNPGRLAIFRYLVHSPSCICNDIVDEFPMSQPTVSKHLKELKRVGLIQGTISGKNVCYCVNPSRWNEVCQAVIAFTKERSLRLPCC